MDRLFQSGSSEEKPVESIVPVSIRSIFQKSSAPKKGKCIVDRKRQAVRFFVFPALKPKLIASGNATGWGL